MANFLQEIEKQKCLF